MGRIAISVKNVSKDFLLPHERADSIKDVFAHPFKKRVKAEVQHALKNISFDIKEGEFFGIVGRNGSGKSTLLKIIAKIYQPTEGSVTVNGRLVPFIELGVGFNPELSGRENTFLNGALMGFSRREIAAKYNSIVEFAELERFMDQKLKNYSSGMQVRLAFSVATILAESDVLLVDEVLAVGDANFQRKCFEYFRSLKKLKKTVVFVSHDMGAVAEYCDRAVLIEKSKIIKKGSPNQVASAYKKMFIDEAKASDKVGANIDTRWGDKKITYTNASVSKPTLKDRDETIVLRATAVANEAVESPLFGFSVNVPTGGHLMGTNNNIKQERIKSMKVGESIEFEWTIPNIFSEGKHTIDLAIEYLNGSETADRWEEALEFEVYRTEQTPYVVSPTVGLKMKIRDAEA